MTYSSAGLLALIIHLVINYDVLWNRSGKELVPAVLSYRRYLNAAAVYYISDILWGILYERQLISLCFADTAVYFAAMAFTILFWTRYVVEYLNERNRFTGILTALGALIFGFQMVVMVFNFFFPVLFWFDENHLYHAGPARYLTLIMQILMFVMTALYAISTSVRNKDAMGLRYRTIGLFSAAMAGFALAQSFFPLLPMYALGCLLGECVLHSFILENEKEEYREDLEVRLQESILKGNYYDLLTELPGMTYFFEMTGKKRLALSENGTKRTVLYFNLSGLKFYNQNYGFTEGDRLLRSFSRLLTAAFGNENCSRFGQDHFAVFTTKEDPERILTDLFRDWKEQGSGYPAIHVGIYPDDDPEVRISTACDCAKIACDSIHRSNQSVFRYFDKSMYVAARKEQYIISHLDQAMAEHWIKVYDQPIVRAANGKVCDEEALARWSDPEQGMLSPADFIPILEDAGVIYRLDLYVVEQVLQKIRTTMEAGLFLVPQSINLSRSDFDNCDIVEEICERVDACGFPHSCLTIEITESVIGSDFEFMREQIGRFRERGFAVWMDDFGSGYSSLDVLQSIQVDLLKLDMRFMQQFEHEEKSRIILTELMKMAIGLGIDTVCEGVEREDQVAFLREIGCSKLQGYYYIRPIPLEQVLERYEKGIQIGFENPDESDYYNEIDRINLYDLSGFAREDGDGFRDYFSSVPMAVLEIQEGRVRFARTNPVFREYIERYYPAGICGPVCSFGDLPESLEQSCAVLFRKCCENGTRGIFDDRTPNGDLLHLFVRRIARNPVTGTEAALVAVLAAS